MAGIIKDLIVVGPGELGYRVAMFWQRAHPEAKAYLNYTLSSTRWRLSTTQTACLSLRPDGQLHDNCAPSIAAGVIHLLRV